MKHVVRDAEERIPQQIGPAPLPVRLGNLILPDLKKHIGQSATLAVHGQGVIRLVIDDVWRVERQIDGLRRLRA